MDLSIWFMNMAVGQGHCPPGCSHPRSVELLGREPRPMALRVVMTHSHVVGVSLSLLVVILYQYVTIIVQF